MKGISFHCMKLMILKTLMSGQVLYIAQNKVKYLLQYTFQYSNVCKLASWILEVLYFTVEKKCVGMSHY